MVFLLHLYFFIVIINIHSTLCSEYIGLGDSFKALEKVSEYQNTSKKSTPLVEYITLQVPESSESTSIIERKAILTYYQEAQATIVLCHGFMCDKYDTGILRQLFPKGTYNVFTFDFRAHGEESHNQWCTFGKNEIHEVITAGTFIKNHPVLKDKPIFAYGFSMGAVAAIEAQAQVPTLFNGMILDCPFASSENVIKKGLENAKINLFGYEFSLPGKYLLEKYAFHPYVQTLVKYTLKCLAKLDAKNINTIIYPLYPVETIKKISVPCFFIHCRHDEKVSIDDAKALYQNAQGFKRLWITNGRRHYDSLFYNPEQYRFHIRQFLQQILDNSYHNQSKEHIWEDALEKPIPVLVAGPEKFA